MSILQECISERTGEQQVDVAQFQEQVVQVGKVSLQGTLFRTDCGGETNHSSGTLATAHCGAAHRYARFACHGEDCRSCAFGSSGAHSKTNLHRGGDRGGARTTDPAADCGSGDSTRAPFWLVCAAFLVHQVEEEIVEAVHTCLQNRFQQLISEQIVDVPVPHVSDRGNSQSFSRRMRFGTDDGAERGFTRSVRVWERQGGDANLCSAQDP